MARPSIRAALFLGAGASRFANFPSVDSFFGHAWPRRGGRLDELCSVLARWISIHEGTNENVNWPTFNAEKLFGWLEILDKAHRIQAVDGGPEGVTISNRRSPGMRADELLSELKQEIVRVYGTKLDWKILSDAPHNDLITLLDTVLPQDEPLYVFTTNYDRLLEQLFQYWLDGNSPLHKQFRVCTGFSSGQPGQWQEALLKEKPVSGIRLVKLAKLHGSTTWKKDVDGGVVDINWARPTPYDLILYFGYKNVPDQEPFLTLHNLLKSTLLEYDFLIAIGFRFADPYIYELFDVALRANPKLGVVCCLTKAPDSGSPLSRMMAQFPSRVHLLTNRSGEPLPFGHKDFQGSLERLLTRTDL